MQELFVQNRTEWERSSKIRIVGLIELEWSSYDELHSSKERSKVFVEVILLLTSLALGRWPELNGVGGEAHVGQAPSWGSHQYQATEEDEKWMPHAEGTPGAEEHPQAILKTLTQRFTAWCIYWKVGNT